jgi:hypothetical protein
VLFIEPSALDATNVHEAFDLLLTEIVHMLSNADLGPKDEANSATRAQSRRRLDFASTFF